MFTWIFRRLLQSFGSTGAAPTALKIGGTWLADFANHLWVADTSGHAWVAEPGGRLWIAGGLDVGVVLVRNVLTESVPGSGTVRLSMDFGDLPELIAGDLLASCVISISPTTSPALAASAVTISTTKYVASSSFTGGTAGDYYVSWTPTLVSGQVLPPRTGQLTLKS